VTFDANPVAVIINRNLREMTLGFQMLLPNFTPVLFDIRAGEVFSLCFLCIQMPSATSRASNHTAATNLSIRQFVKNRNVSSRRGLSIRFAIPT
jgi:hypothetical protein